MPKLFTVYLLVNLLRFCSFYFMHMEHLIASQQCEFYLKISFWMVLVLTSKVANNIGTAFTARNTNKRNRLSRRMLYVELLLYLISQEPTQYFPTGRLWDQVREYNTSRDALVRRNSFFHPILQIGLSYILWIG